PQVLTVGPGVVGGAGTVAERLGRPLPAGSTHVSVGHLRYADADSLARVLAQLVGLPPGPPPERKPHGSSLMRASARRTELGLGYEAGGPGTVPPPAPPVAGSAEAVPLLAPGRIT